jgi:CubicO group peptidase (beta-lactamase class C family)
MTHQVDRKRIFILALALVLGLSHGRRVEAQWVILKDKHDSVTRNIPDEASKALDDLARRGVTLKSIAFAPGGGWVIFHGRNGWIARDVPQEATKILGDLARRGAELKSISFTPGGGWAILFDRHGVLVKGIPDEAAQRLATVAGRGEDLKWVSFTPDNGWVILFGRDGLLARNVPDQHFRTIDDLNKKGEFLKSVTFAPDGGCVILFGRGGVIVQNVPDEVFQAFKDLIKKDVELKSVGFLSSRPPLKFAMDDAESRKQILSRMASHKVPGLGIALINNYQVEWARGYGLIQEGGSEPVTAQTRFQAASISKPVTALAALRLVQEGKLKLDQPLNEKLLAWKVPENDFTRLKAPTLRMVLSHSAGFTVHGFGGYEVGGRLPSLVQVLNGESPANSPAVRVEFRPGSKSQYSGGGYTVLQEMMQDTLKKPFPRAMQDLILDPLAMKESTYQQPLPQGIEAAVAHVNGAPIRGRWHVYPEMAAAGLWTTPSDLARFVVAVQKAKRGDKDAILSQELAREMLKPQIGDMGLGVVLVGNGKSSAFLHSGSNAGFECQFIGFPETGQGVVLMTNAQGGQALIDELIRALRAEYGWPG